MTKVTRFTRITEVVNKAVGWIGALGKAEEPSRTRSGTQGDDNAAQRVKTPTGRRGSTPPNPKTKELQIWRI